MERSHPRFRFLDVRIMVTTAMEKYTIVEYNGELTQVTTTTLGACFCNNSFRKEAIQQAEGPEF